MLLIEAPTSGSNSFTFGIPEWEEDVYYVKNTLVHDEQENIYLALCDNICPLNDPKIWTRVQITDIHIEPPLVISQTSDYTKYMKIEKLNDEN